VSAKEAKVRTVTAKGSVDVMKTEKPQGVRYYCRPCQMLKRPKMTRFKTWTSRYEHEQKHRIRVTFP